MHRLFESRRQGYSFDGDEKVAAERDVFSNILTAASLIPGIDTLADAAKVADDVYDCSKFPHKIHEGNQGKHIIGNNEYQSERGRSIVTISVEKIMELVKKYTGTGRCHNSYRETVDFGEVIGKYIDPETGIAYDTTRVTIHYSQKGFHIVPAKPENWRKK